MKLSELTPKAVKFEVSEVGLVFRPFTIGDDLKAQDVCGGQKEVIAAFQDFDFKKISLVAWYQLTITSQKRVVTLVEGVYIDPETGAETKANLKPIEKFRNLFLGIPDQIALLTNLLKCRGLNIPDLDDDKALKKWVDQLAPLLPSTGQSSLI